MYTCHSTSNNNSTQTTRPSEAEFSGKARGNAYHMEGPLEVMQLKNPYGHEPDTFTLYRCNSSGTSYLSLSTNDPEYRVLQSNTERLSSLHSHEYYEFLFVLDGEIYQNIEHERHYYPAGGCCLVKPDVLHTEEYLTECRVLFFKITPDFLKNLLRFSDCFPSDDCRARLHLNEYLASDRYLIDFIPSFGYDWIRDHVHNIFEEMVLEMSSPTENITLHLGLLTYQLLMQLFNTDKFGNTPAAPASHGDQELFYQIREYMMNAEGKVSRATLEEHFNYSGDYLYKLIKMHTGHSIQDYSSYLSMKKAAGLLTDSNYKINQIAELVGYHNYTYFYREFDRHYHMTPRQYRQIHQANHQTTLLLISLLLCCLMTDLLLILSSSKCLILILNFHEIEDY